MKGKECTHTHVFIFWPKSLTSYLDVAKVCIPVKVCVIYSVCVYTHVCFEKTFCYLKGFTSGCLSLHPELVRTLLSNSDEGISVLPHVCTMQCGSVPVLYSCALLKYEMWVKSISETAVSPARFCSAETVKAMPVLCFNKELKAHTCTLLPKH